MSETRTPAEIRTWFEANAGTVAANLAAERAVRAILAMHDEVTVIVFDDAQPVCREDGQEYDGVDLPGCRTTRAINAEINHVLAGDAIVTGPPVSSQDTPPPPGPAREWANAAGERWMDHPHKPDTLVLLATASGPTHHVVQQSRAGVEAHGGPLTEVPVSTDPDGGDR